MTYEEIVREPGIKLADAVDVLDLFRGKRNIQCLQIALQMLDFTTTDDGEYVGGFVHDVGDSDYGFQHQDGKSWKQIERTY